MTEKGNQSLEDVSVWSDFLRNVVKELPAAEQEDLLRSLIKIIKTLQEREQIPISKMCVTCRFFQPNVHTNSNRPHHCSFVDASFGNRDLRLECPEQVKARPETIDKNWQKFRL